MAALAVMKIDKTSMKSMARSRRNRARLNASCKRLVRDMAQQTKAVEADHRRWVADILPTTVNLWLRSPR